MPLLLELQQFFWGVGRIIIDKKNNSFKFRVTKLSDLNNVIIPHFLNFNLLTQKAADFILFQRAVQLILKKAPQTAIGLQEIINIRASMNLGLNDILKSNFINTVPVDRPRILTNKIPDQNWLSGFFSAEGNFDVNIQKSKTNKIGFSVRLRFRIGQHVKELKLIELLNKNFNSGSIYKYSSSPAVSLTISNFSVITKTIIPLLNKYPLIGVKQYDYLD